MKCCKCETGKIRHHVLGDGMDDKYCDQCFLSWLWWSADMMRINKWEHIVLEGDNA